MTHTLKGLTGAETDYLRFVLGVAAPWKRDRLSRKFARFFDGDRHALDDAPKLRQQFLDLEAKKELSVWPLPGSWRPE